MPLTTQTLINYARLELRRDARFAVFCEQVLAELRQHMPLPDAAETCLELEIAPGIPIAKLFIEAYERQADEPGWRRANVGMERLRA